MLVIQKPLKSPFGGLLFYEYSIKLKKCNNLFTNFNIHSKLAWKHYYLCAIEILSSASLYYFNKPVISELKKKKKSEMC